MRTTHVTVEHIQLQSAKPFDEARADLERQLGKYDATGARLLADENPAVARARIEAMAGPSGLMVFEARDHGSLLSIAGHPRKALQYVIGNPLYASQMTQHAIGASLYAPLRLLLYENDQGATCIEYDRPSSLFGQFGNEKVNEVAASLDQKLAALAVAALASSPAASDRAPTDRPNDPPKPTGAEQQLYLDDLRVGQRFVSGTHRIDEQQIKAFASQFDPQPFHLDAEAAKRSLFAGLVASGWHTAAITMRLMVDGGLPIAGGLVGAGGECTWPNPTRPGAILQVESEILELRPSRSRPDRGMATVRSETRNQLGEIVQVLIAKLVVPRRASISPRS
jgi:acyl dehydratase/uncharacterized protein (DUF302 family)